MNKYALLLAMATVMVAACASSPESTALSATDKAERSASLRAQQFENSDYLDREWRTAAADREAVKQSDANVARLQNTTP